MEPIRVVIWGLGTMGTLMAKILSEKEGIEITGAVDLNPEKAGKSLGDITGSSRHGEITVTAKADEVLERDGDLVLLATSSFIGETAEPVRQIVKSGKNVITIAEEWAFPRLTAPKTAEEIDGLAKACGVTVLGTGVNPGFVLDTLIIALTGACAGVSKISARRVNDLSPFGPTVMASQGIGLSPEEFGLGLERGVIAGHIGFEQSIHMIASSLGIRLEKITQSIEPIISRTSRKTACVSISPGQVAGCSHRAEGWSDDSPVIILEHPQQVHPETENVETGDFIHIEGTPDIRLAIQPEIPGGTATAALAVNMIPHVLNAPAGLACMMDLPVPSARLADFRQFLK